MACPGVSLGLAVAVNRDFVPSATEKSPESRYDAPRDPRGVLLRLDFIRLFAPIRRYGCNVIIAYIGCV